MRLHLTLQNRPGSRLSLNYNYEVSSAVYKILSLADPAFSAWLHDVGYPLEGRKFKLFTISNLRFGEGFRINRQDGTVTLGGRQYLSLSFFVNEAVEKFVAGVFREQCFGIGTKDLPAIDFQIQSVEVEPPPTFGPTMRFRTMSPIVMSRYEEGNRYEQYMSPEEPGYERQFFDNLLNKYESARLAGLVGALPEGGEMKFRLLSQPHKRGVLIKAGTGAMTKVIGYEFEFELAGPVELLRFGYEAGMGLDNPVFGCVGVGR
ncbi:MAG: CRISPR-associated endoribonuclease Cas6 [Saprospiraceae bacterium]|nr:CRISPR-associated endoribonuclease Cas6 [Saprospiraceae bacterium]MCF8252461.1 CRISPR-associated endoribonuclease Cas6 [Saprospiraceae bacterium]MCF8282328.1 CRISPR-associated endoribonuclease Cas6 [Bacteroidales bacterium]MCF8314052.1 CRISPR-associated endoribonuclease Cas6 [Saprospiraceae bacterium]MCF8442790.1 CRISPR-associated endoribonuclease Cas6 [Saprospiraceae bacterium]